MNKSRLPRKEYVLSESDFLRMISGYTRYKQGGIVEPKFWFDRGDYVLTLEVKV